MSKEHNFVSAVVYLHNCAADVPAFLTMLYGQLEENFEKYEIVCVNDASTDNSADINAPADKKGCGASIGLLSVLALSVCAAFALKRRR